MLPPTIFFKADSVGDNIDSQYFVSKKRNCSTCYDLSSFKLYIPLRRAEMRFFTVFSKNVNKFELSDRMFGNRNTKSRTNVNL